MLPSHLDTLDALGLRKAEPVAQYELGNLRNFVYLILDWENRKAAMIDSQSDFEGPLEALREHGFELTGVFLTHSHHDHVAGLSKLLERFPGLPIHIHPMDVRRLQGPPLAAVRPIQDGQSVQIGSISLQVLHTPGHSPGECCYFFEGSGKRYLFTGDTLFIRDCGRTDFEGGSNEQMFASLQRIKSLPAETVILPGHHYAKECASVLSRELQESPPLRCASVAELATLP